MSKRILIRFFIVIVFFGILGDLDWGRRDMVTNSSAQVELDLRLEIMSSVSLQIGSPGMHIDTVRFHVNDIPENQPFVEGDYQPPVQILTNLGTLNSVNLTADSAGGLFGPSGKMPFSVISWEGTGDLAGQKGRFDGTPNQQIIRFSGKGKRVGNLKFIYRNTYDYPPGTYYGTIIYTLSSP